MMDQNRHDDDLTDPQAELAAALRQALATLPEPRPGPGFEQALLAQGMRRARRLRRRRWLLAVAATGAAAASLVVALLPSRRPPAPPRSVVPARVDQATLAQIAQLGDLAPLTAIGAALPAGVGELVAEARAEQSQLRAQIEAAEGEVRRELERDPADLEKIDRGLDRIATLEAAARKARVHAWLRIRSQLAPEQRRGLVAGPTRDAPQPDRDTLTVFRRGAKLCLERALKRDRKLAGDTLQLHLHVDSDGTAVVLDVPERYRRAFVGQCLASLASHLPWPPGAAYDLELPLAFPAREQGDADALANQGMEAYVHGEYRRAVELTGRALALNPNHQAAMRIQGAAYCKLKNRAAAQATFHALEPQLRMFVAYVCRNEGVELAPVGVEGFLSVDSQPWARVWIDGRDTGKTTPVSKLPLTPGKHTLTLVSDQQRYNTEVTIRTGEVARVVRNLERP